MFRFFYCLLMVVAACAGSPISSKILGGSDADIASFPYMVSVDRLGDNLCSAAIVSADWALTDVYCAGSPNEIRYYTIRSGSAVLGDGKYHNVVQSIHHPKSDVSNSEYYFSLMKVNPPFEFGENVAAVTLATQDQDTPNNAEALIAGWGSVDGSGPNPNSQLQYANITILGEAQCSEILGADFHYSKLCAQDFNGLVALCFRDEGGPLVVDGTAFGIALWPRLCGDPQKVQVYSRIASVRDWIDATIAG